MSKTKNILVKLTVDGQGVVNYDSAENLKWLYRSFKGHRFNNPDLRFDNATFAKKIFIKNDEGEVIDKLKISSNCLKNAMFGEDYVGQSPNIMHVKELLYHTITSKMSLVRGYMFAGRTITLKRKGAVTISDAIQEGNSPTTLEFCVRSGEKVVTKEDKDADSDTSIFRRETIGDVKYQSKAQIDISQLFFISADQKYDRMAFSEDQIALMNAGLKKTFNKPDKEFKLGFYKLKNSAIDIPELGLHLEEDEVKVLLKYILSKLLGINIKRNSGYAYTETLQVLNVENALNNRFNSVNGWQSLDSEDALNAYVDSLSIESNYVEVDWKQATLERDDLKLAVETDKNAKAEAKAAKAKK